MTIDGTRPFVLALGPELTKAAPTVREHLALVGGRSIYSGFVRHRWARGPAGWIASRILNLGGARGDRGEERFDLRNEVVEHADGTVAMLWHRTHHMTGKPLSGIGLLRWDPSRRALIDSIGRRAWLEVELVPSVENGAVVMASRRQWARVGGLRLPLPRFLFGTAETREWEESDGRLGLSLTLRHPLLGPYAGYEAILTPGERP